MMLHPILVSMRLIWVFWLVFLSTAQALADQSAGYQVKGLQAFDNEQQTKLRAWLSYAVSATQNTLGPYPFDMQLVLHPRKASQPVPWANTWREGPQRVHFYVDARFPQQRFIDDWTAYHELSHLAIPYLGSWNSWFAEGFASFMQYQIMAGVNLLDMSPAEAYQGKIAPQVRWYNSEYSAAAVARRLMKNGRYPAAYWGSAWFFVVADRQLQQDYGKSLTQLVARYQQCCRMTDHNLEQVLNSWDALLEKPLFVPLYQEFENTPAKQFFQQWFIAEDSSGN
ncbi:hypothetical protein GCM10010982_13650 [Bowmanella pacifica]|uniref:Peptidase M61 catalytic domain-containing protein n=2 Tax=Bowmanella pacifica TaxID=502051 RepID=A0A917YXS2_9ALTE|nr:hypothetical protein GCM10010982_13650 [Bowmanella pacifica]